jgi:ribosomal-protein-alanine N-acetyltransferase
MTEALTKLTQFAFRTVGLNRLQANVMPENIASVGLLQKLGFKNEGVLQEYETWPGKGYVDLIMFSMLTRDFVAIQAPGTKTHCSDPAVASCV